MTKENMFYVTFLFSFVLLFKDKLNEQQLNVIVLYNEHSCWDIFVDMIR